MRSLRASSVRMHRYLLYYLFQDNHSLTDDRLQYLNQHQWLGVGLILCQLAALQAFDT